uniref:Malic domain-containing protein n=1 Tax=Panagrellus redivivus TaxID=6233 RepID=A0A7E4VBU8_PANRE
MRRSIRAVTSGAKFSEPPLRILRIRVLKLGSSLRIRVPKTPELPALPSINLFLVDNIVSLVKKLLVIDVTQRYTAMEALTCDFFGGWDLVEPDNERIVDNRDIRNTFEALKTNQLLIDIGNPTKDECEVLGASFADLQIN